MSGCSAGIVDHDVDFSVFGDCSIDNGLATLTALDVALDEMNAVAAIHFFDRLSTFFGATAIDDHACPVGKEPLGNGSANTAGTSCDDSNSSLKFHSYPPVPLATVATVCVE